MARKTPIMWGLSGCGRAGYQVDQYPDVAIEVLVVTVHVTVSFMGIILSPLVALSYALGIRTS
jgi:hypothetical protein